jgi:hypothetical protein
MCPLWGEKVQLRPSIFATEAMFPAPKACAGVARRRRTAMVKRAAEVVLRSGILGGVVKVEAAAVVVDILVVLGMVLILEIEIRGFASGGEENVLCICSCRPRVLSCLECSGVSIVRQVVDDAG